MTNDTFRTLMEKAYMLKRSDLIQLLQMSVTVNSILNKLINKQEDQYIKNVQGAPSGIPFDVLRSVKGNKKNMSVLDSCFNVLGKEQQKVDKLDKLKKSSKSGCTTISLRGARQRDAGPDYSDSQLGQMTNLTTNLPHDAKSGKSEQDACLNTDNSPPWEEIARKNQLMPEGNWRIWLLLAGRGFGKTRAAAEAIRKLALSGKYNRIALIANTIEEAKQVMVEGVSGLQNISRYEDGLTYIPSRRELRWKNGAIATLYGAENYQQLRGPQFDLAWVDEFAKFLYPRETFEQLSFALRMGEDPKLILTTTPRPIPFIKELMTRNDVVTVRGSSLENENNLSPTFLKHLEYLKGTRLEAQEIYAEIVEDNPNTLWSWRDIESCYRDPPHFIDNIVIGVDPAMTSRDNSDETGIVVVGKDFCDRAFVLEDASMRAAPDVWAKKVADLYKKYRARKVVIETNAGGELLEQILLREDPALEIHMVRARESKICRAQPVVILYQKNLVFHAKQFRELEMEMATYEPGQKSPDRMDALVWALTYLFELESHNYVPRAFLI